ncbi:MULTISPECIES: glycosyltransferase [unclassified Sphingopyxis]|uniref:glycosyltransferase n=1 Tax=unclassified Sphingopyxis TaxID=2614943 RepID=UPI000AE23973|nr:MULTISPECIES: hypothetical protein [unclassified Sphingopyxis]
MSAYLDRGWKVTVAARHLPRAKEVLAALQKIGKKRLAVVQAPIFLHRAKVFEKQPVSLADVFAQIGFADGQIWRPVIRAWRRLLDEAVPDVVLSDFAPSLNVVATGHCRLFVIGNGWTVPPEGVLPTFENILNDASTSEVSDHIVEALEIASDGRSRLSTFSDLLRGDANFVCTLPQLDPYRLQRAGEHYWPVEISKPGPVPVGTRDLIAVYLPEEHPALSLVQTVAEQLPWKFRAYVGDTNRVSTERLLFASEPLNLSELLPSARLAVHHGGLGMANWCLINRVPQLIFPTDMEKLLVGRGIENANAGLITDRRIAADDLFAMIKSLSGAPIPQPDISAMQTVTDTETLTHLLQKSCDPRSMKPPERKPSG